MLRFLAVLLVVLCLAAGGAWIWAGRADGPVIALSKPDKIIGPGSTLELKVAAPGGQFSRVEVTIEQNGTTLPVYALDQRMQAPAAESADEMYVMRAIGKEVASRLKAGPARLVVRAARPVLYGLREAESVETRDVQVRLEPPRVAVLSTFHYINHGGSEFVVYRATPEDVESGVRVGEIEYPGYPAKGAGIATADPAMRVAFFALLFDQDRDTPINVFARDPSGTQALAPLDRQVFAKPYGKSRIQIDDAFIGRVVPAIASNSPGENIPTDDVLAGFLKINGDLRRKNNQYLMDMSKKSAPEMMFMDAFQQLGNSQVEARFADARTYIYKGKEVDQQVHLGFDLAVTAQAPIAAAHRGIVVHAADLGIYGNCVVIDHGLGVQSLYGHLSSIEVKPGDRVEKGQRLGRSGMTGLAGGDHLHFTMLVAGQQVTPVDWWSAQWIQDRVLRKIGAAGNN